MNLGESVDRISNLPAFVRAYMLAKFAVSHPEEFERYYLEGTMHDAC